MTSQRKRANFTEEHRTHLSESHMGELNGMYGREHSEKTRLQIAESMLGKKQTPEQIAKKAAASRGTVRERVQCPYCSTIVAVNMYKRWHGDNCKSKR